MDTKIQISLRISQDEKEAIQKYADVSGMTLTDYMICKALGPSSCIDNTNLNEFRISRLRTERDLFELVEDCKTKFSNDNFAEIMNAINKLMEEVKQDYDKEDEMFLQILNGGQNNSENQNQEAQDENQGQQDFDSDNTDDKENENEKSVENNNTEADEEYPSRYLAPNETAFKILGWLKTDEEK